MEPRQLASHLTWLLLAISCFVVLASYHMLSYEVAESGDPFGVFSPSEEIGSTVIVDFPTHLNYARHFWEGEPPQPYTMEAQREMVLNWVPTAQSGMPFAYSPVAVLLSYPFTLLPTAKAFLLWSGLSVLVATLLWRLYLTPRIQGGSDLVLALVSVLSLSFFSTLIIGQTSILTAAAVAGTWAVLWDFSEQRWRKLDWGSHLLLALLLFLVASKPSIAIAVGAMLLAARAWLALAMGALLCLATGLALSPVLGGFPEWISDYRALLDGYHQDAVGDFMRPGLPPHILTSLLGFLDQRTDWGSGFNSSVCKYLWLGGTAALIAFVFFQKLSGSAFFRLNLLWFLIFCPHVSATEDWILALAVVQPLRPTNRKQAYPRPTWLVEVLLLAAAVNFRQGVPFESLDYAPALFAKLALLGLWGWQAIKRPE